MSRPEAPQSEEVFLSYSRTDSEACVVLRAALLQANLSVYRDEDATREGDRWLTRLEQTLERCSAFVVLVGRDGVRRWVGAEVQVALTRHLAVEDETLRLPIFPVLLEGTPPEALPPFLALFQAVRWSPDEPVPLGLIDAIARTTRFVQQYTFEGCPFLGLSAFGRADAKLFFGRRKETLEALASLGDQQQTDPKQLRNSSGASYHRWLQIEGNSGAGKSSLVNAGMVPMIEQGALWARTGFEHWRILGPMMPGTDPLASLAEVLEEGLIEDPVRRDSLGRLKRLADDPRALTFTLRDFKQENRAFLLVVDQFEELFTFAEEQSRKQFDALLAHTLQDPDCPLFLISTVRADFLDRYEQLPRLQTIYNSRCKRYFLPTISEHGLREVIEQPARLAGLDVRDVTAAILEDARDEIGALPLVENALFTLWKYREGDRLSAERYRQERGLVGILSAQADALLERIDRSVPKGKQAALEVLLRLTRINDEGRHTRQRVTREEAVFVAGGDNHALGERVIRLLTGERDLSAAGAAHTGTLRLVTLSAEGDRTFVDLIHETLIRARGKDAQGKLQGYWPTLYNYIEKNRNRDILRQQLNFQAERWLHSSRLGRVWHVAGWGDLRSYRRLRVPRRSMEARFLSFSRRQAAAQLTLLMLLLGFIAESYYWTRKHDLPLDAMLSLQRYRLGYAPLPELTDIRPGSFLMGEQDTELRDALVEDERETLGAPVRSVAIAYAFRLSKYEVTYEQFDYYVWAQQRAGLGDARLKFPATAEGGRGVRPVVNVSWNDATAYIEWFGQRTGQSCRLPSEAEWEYAARAGAQTGYWWGDDVMTNKANCNGCGSRWDDKQSAPVGSFAPNRFGLYDMSGNVFEWTCSAWRREFDGQHEKECADRVNTIERRVVRGGSWKHGTVLSRLAGRYSAGTSYSNNTGGFRVFCLLP